MSKTLVSIIICSRNRADELFASAREVALQSRILPNVEVIVVDNGSTDNTRKVVEALILEFGPQVRYVHEPTAGLCQARNRGRAEARGSVLAYIDDDVIVSHGWVERLLDNFYSDKVDCLGGKVTADLRGELPFPMDDSMLWFFQVTNFGEIRRLLTYPEHPIGCNMAFRTEVFDAVGGFDTNLKLYGDETDFFRRVNESGIHIYYDPLQLVTQHIPAARLTKQAIKEKSYKWGRGSATVWLLSKRTRLRRLARILEYTVRSMFLWVRLSNGQTFGRYYTYWYNRGYLSSLMGKANRDT